MLSTNRIKCVPMPELVITSCLHSISYIASKFSVNNIRWLNFLSEWCASLLLFNTRTRKKIANCISSLVLSTACCWKWSIKIFVSLEKTSYQERGNTWRGDCSLAIRPSRVCVFVSVYVSWPLWLVCFEKGLLTMEILIFLESFLPRIFYMLGEFKIVIIKGVFVKAWIFVSTLS